MSMCKKFVPNIFNKAKCSNCFRQKEEHSSQALECNRASRTIARSGYLFVAPDWDFSVPLNRTKRWQRRWFVLYDDGELNYSVDEHPDTIPQGSVDMSKVLEVTAAEQVTGHPHSIALTSPDRVTFIKAASREDARWWVEVLAMFPRRHKRNATFPGGRASPSLPQFGRSASPQPLRSSILARSGACPRLNFETPPLKEEKSSAVSVDQVDSAPCLVKNVQVLSSKQDEVVPGSPPVRDELSYNHKTRARREWRNERFRDIATALTGKSSESSLAFPSEGLLHLKKGWLWVNNSKQEWIRCWAVLCLPTLSIYKEQNEQDNPQYAIDLLSLDYFNEISIENKYAFEISWSGTKLIISAATESIRNNWLQALRKAVPASHSENFSAQKSVANGSNHKNRPESNKIKTRSFRSISTPSQLSLRVPTQIRLTTVEDTPSLTSDDSSLDSVKQEISPPSMKKVSENDNNDLHKELLQVLKEKSALEQEVARLKKVQSTATIRDNEMKALLSNLEYSKQQINEKALQIEMFTKEHQILQSRLADLESISKIYEEKFHIFTKELETKQNIISNLQKELLHATDKNKVFKTNSEESNKNFRSLENQQLHSLPIFSDANHEKNCSELRYKLERAQSEIKNLKAKLGESYENYDKLELEKVELESSLKLSKKESQAEINLLATRLQDLANKLALSEKQTRTKSKSELKEKRRSLSLRGRESFSINKEMEEKIIELEGKLLSMEKSNNTSKKKHRSDSVKSDRPNYISRKLRRKSLDSATYYEPMELIEKLNMLESKVTNFNTSMEDLTIDPKTGCDVFENQESLEISTNKDIPDKTNTIKTKISDCLSQLKYLRNKISQKSSLDFKSLEFQLNEISNILKKCCHTSLHTKSDDLNSSVNIVVKQFENILTEKLTELYKKRIVLKEQNKLTLSAKVNLLAQKFAYESILIERLQKALKADQGFICEQLFRKELRETECLISCLHQKFNGTYKHKEPRGLGFNHLSSILAQALTHSAQSNRYFKNYFPQRDSRLDLLEEQQKELDNQLSLYKSKKLSELADCLAIKTMQTISDKSCWLVSLNESKNKFTIETQKIVNSELMQAEISHVMLKAAQTYENLFNNEHQYVFSFFAAERAGFELWADAVEEQLNKEINRCIDELFELYKKSLEKYQPQNYKAQLNLVANSSSTLLHEFADIIAHKSLIDAKILVLSGNFKNDHSEENPTSDIKIDKLLNGYDCWSCLENQSIPIERNVEAEFLTVLGNANNECYSVVAENEIKDIIQRLDDILKDTQYIQELPAKLKADNFKVNWDETHVKCDLIRKTLMEIKHQVQQYFVSNSTTEHTHLDKIFSSQLDSFNSEHHDLINTFKQKYPNCDFHLLVTMNERLLKTIEDWHQKTIWNLKRAHANEIKVLEREKEQALAEETQATLAALDVMRKVHEAEVHSEIMKFKQEFMKSQNIKIGDYSLDYSQKLALARQLEGVGIQLACNSYQDIKQS